MNVINILAIALSPLIAVLVSTYLQDRKEKRNLKLHVFNTLVATRHTGVSDERTRVLNMVDVVFYDCETVRRLWHEYFEMLNNQGLNNPNGWSQRQKKNLEMVTEMAKTLNYEKAITHLDMDRVYNPQGLLDETSKSTELMDELLRVLKASGGLSVSPRNKKP